MKLRRETSLNHAKIKDNDIHNLQIREQLLEVQQLDTERANLTLKIMQNENQDFREQMLKRYRLRKGKQFMFNLEHGYIHRPKTTPWLKIDKKPKVKDIIDEKNQQNGAGGPFNESATDLDILTPDKEVEGAPV